MLRSLRQLRNRRFPLIDERGRETCF